MCFHPSPNYSVIINHVVQSHCVLETFMVLGQFDDVRINGTRGEIL